MSYSDLLKVTPYEFQKEAIEFHLKHKYSINGYTMGLGKTLIAIAVALETSKHTLIVVPAYLQENWAKEIEKFCGDSVKVQIVKSVLEACSKDVNFYIVSFTSFMKAHKTFPDIDMVIADEAVALKNPKAKRTKEFDSMVKTHRPKRLLLMSGTPVRNNVIEFWQLLKLIWYGGKYPQFDKYRRSDYSFKWQFCNREHVWADKFKFVGLRNKKELSQLIRPIYIRKRSSEVLDLPKTVNRTIKLGKTSKLDKEISEAWEKFLKDNNELAFSSIKAKSALYKVKATVELAKEIMEGGHKVVIFTCHRESAAQLSESLDAPLITGSVPSSKRSKIIEQYQSRDRGGLVGTVGAMSTGFTITSATHMIFNDLPWVPTDMAQAKKRIHRIGQTETCFYHYIISSDIDYQIYQTILNKTKTIMEVINV